MKVMVQYERRSRRGICLDRGKAVVEAVSVAAAKEQVMHGLPGYTCLTALQQFDLESGGSYTAGLHGLHGDDADA